MENSRCRVPSSPRRSRRASLTSKCDVRSDPSLVFRLRTWACAVGDGRWAVGGGPGRRLGGGPGRRLGRRPRVLRRASGPQGSRAGTVGRLPSPTAHLCGRRARWSFVGKRAGHDTIELGHEGRGRRGRTRLGRRVPGPVDPVARRLHRRQCFRHRTAIWDGRAIRQTRERGKERKKARERRNEWGVLPPTRLLEPLHARVLRPLAEVRRVVACVVEERGKLSGNRRLRRRPARAPEATQRAGLFPGSAEPARAARRALRRRRSRAEALLPRGLRPRASLSVCLSGRFEL